MYKFRGKSKRGDKWVYGSLTELDGRMFIVGPGKGWLYRSYSKSVRNLNVKDAWEVHPESVGMWTGLKDKNGVEIYDGSVIKVKMQYMERDFEADYKVSVSPYKGMSLYIVNSITPECTFHCSIQWENGGLCTAYVDCNYDKLAMHATHGKNPHFRTSWNEQEYSEDIEVIGNTTDNPELLTKIQE